MTKDEIIEVMKLIAIEKGSRFSVTPERVDLWHEILGRIEFKHARKAVVRLLSEASEWPPDAGEVRSAALTVANEEAQARRREFEEQQEKLRVKEKPLCELSPEEAEAGRQRGLSILRDCIAKMEAKKAGVK